MPLIYFGLLFLRGSVVTWLDFVSGFYHILYSRSLFIFFDVVRQRAPHLFWFFHTSCSFVVMWFDFVLGSCYTLYFAFENCCIMCHFVYLSLPIVKLCFRVTDASPTLCSARIMRSIQNFPRSFGKRALHSLRPSIFLNWVLLTSCQVLITYYIRFWCLSDNVSGPYHVAILFVFGYCQTSCRFTHLASRHFEQSFGVTYASLASCWVLAHF
jgi:hypothetical protein